jgi:hypothetical protein
VGGAIGTGAPFLAEVGDTADQIFATPRTHLHEFKNVNHPINDFLGRGVLDPVSALFRKGVLNGQDIGEKLFEGRCGDE